MLTQTVPARSRCASLCAEPGCVVKTPAALPGDDPLFVGAIARGFRVLAAFHGASGPLSLGEIAARSGLGKSAVQRIVHMLRQQGYLRRARA
ncbi:MAG: helix-turn-helix domain-containing protein [Roseovarius sp.]|nr:helix-turn-helix domain-containing protein [Roseovarius sp.]